MNGLKDTLANLSKLRSRFEQLLSSHSKAQSSPSAFKASQQLQAVEGFGSNPGNLRMLMHLPRDLPDAPALVVALHGCTQTAADFDHGSGWSTLADASGFAVVFPEQQRANNPNTCFNWFLPADVSRGTGEAASIRHMIDYMVERHGIDRARVFIVGLSAGGAMAAAMLAAYPDVFAGGAVIAGLPYGGAANVQEALQMMARPRRYSPAEWGDIVRTASSHRGPWPKISLWHGSADSIVHPENMEDAIKQWGNVHGLAAAPSMEQVSNGYSRRVWSAGNGDAVLEAIAVSGMNHGVPIATTGDDRCGTASAFHLDVGISSTRHIAAFWGIAGKVTAASNDYANPEIDVLHRQEQIQPTPLIPVEAIPNGRSDGGQPASIHDPRPQITAALKAAGLLDKPSAGGNPFDPKRIVQNTLRSVGLLK